MSKRLVLGAGVRTTLAQFVAVGMLAAIENTPTAAQIIPQPGFGAEGSVVQSGVSVQGTSGDRIDGGALRGTNLFHSFLDFNVGNGQRVYFSQPAGVQTILSRVTGGSTSQILGTLGVLGTANLVLLNPNGITFGPNARLDVAGSFIASTAESFVLDNGFAFSGTESNTSPLLTVNLPLGLQSNSGPLQVQQATLQVPPGKTLALVGGAVNLDSATLQAPEGQIAIGGRTIDITGGSAIAGGDIVLQTPRLRLDRSTVAAETTRSTGGNVTLQVADYLVLRNGSELTARALSAGTGGNVTINTTFILAVFSENSNIRASAVGGTGGNVNITALSLWGVRLREQLTPLSDITVSAQFRLEGAVRVELLYPDILRALAALPTRVTDVSELITQRCDALTATPAEQGSEFVVTGRGGVPPTPSEPLNPDALWQDLQAYGLEGTEQRANIPDVSTPVASVEAPVSIVEAQAWSIDIDGSVLLVAQATPLPSLPRLTPATCLTRAIAD